MIKRRNFGKCLMLIISVSIFLCVSASAAADELDGSEYIDEDNSLPNSDSEILDGIKKDPQFIASRGSFSEVSDDYADFFSNPVSICWDNVTKKDQFFTEFDDPVIGFSSGGAGYIIVELESESSEKVNETTVDEIYHIIDEYCEQEGISEVPVVFMWSHIEEDLPLPDYGPQIFEEVKNEPGFIATRGTMPVITDESEKREWIDSLVNSKRSLPRSEYLPYFVEFGGPVTSFGPGINGYLSVGFDPSTPEKVNESVIDEIYQVIDEHFEQEGINDVPVVFEWIGVPVEDIAVVDGPYVNESDDSSLPGNEEEINGSETTSKMPGFTSIMLVLCLLFLFNTRK